MVRLILKNGPAEELELTFVANSYRRTPSPTGHFSPRLRNLSMTLRHWNALIQNPPAAGFHSTPSMPFTVANSIRFFNSWLRRIAPDTQPVADLQLASDLA